jgi:hypothetical protein
MTSLSGNQLMKKRTENLNFGLVPAAQTKFRKITSIRTTITFLSKTNKVKPSSSVKDRVTT